MAKKTPKTGKASTKKTSDILDGLTPKQSAYVVGRVEGKTKMQAALDAGYSQACAESPTASIESDNVRQAFRRLVQKAIPPQKIVERLAEGLDATSSLGGDGEVTYKPDFRERREYVKLAATYGGYHVEKSEIDINDTTPDSSRLTELLARAAARLNQSTDPERKA